MYYIIEHRYVGPNQEQDQYVDLDFIEINSAPALTNSSHEPRIDGWCGTTDDWSVNAHGEYLTIDDARDAMLTLWSDVRWNDPNGDCYGGCYPVSDFSNILVDDPGRITICKPGKYTPMSRSATGDWACESMQHDIQADTTDEHLDILVAEYEEDAQATGYTLDSGLIDWMREYRDGLPPI